MTLHPCCCAPPWHRWHLHNPFKAEDVTDNVATAQALSRRRTIVEIKEQLRLFFDGVSTEEEITVSIPTDKLLLNVPTSSSLPSNNGTLWMTPQWFYHRQGEELLCKRKKKIFFSLTFSLPRRGYSCPPTSFSSVIIWKLAELRLKYNRESRERYGMCDSR